MLLSVAVLSVLHRGEEGVEETEVMVSGRGLFTKVSLSSEDCMVSLSFSLPVG